MKVVFAYHSWTGEYGLFGHFAKRNSTWPPLNLALLAAVCEDAGHDVQIIDGEAEGLRNEELAQKVVDAQPDIVGLTAYSPFFHLTCDIAEAIKKINQDIPIMVGGPHITIEKEKAFKPQFDYLFKGEAERSLPMFLDTHDKMPPGIIYRKTDGSIIDTGEPLWVATDSMKKADMSSRHPLDSLPLPARHLLPMKSYRLGNMTGRSHFTSLQTARGCPWRCIFCCSDKLMTTRYIMKSPKRVVEEMADIKSQFPYISHIYIVDDVLTFWPEHVIEICDRMDAEGLKFTFESSTRANLVDDKLIERLARSGLIRLSFGLETVDPVMRVTMQKKVPLQAYADANRICKKYGVEAMNSLMIGLPGETRESIKETIEWVRAQRDISQANVAVAMPYPGTEFAEMALEGTHGVELLDKDFGKYLRYGNAVTKVGDLTPEDLVEEQNYAFWRIYSAPWRWLPVIKKHGITGFLLQFIRLFKIWLSLIRKATQPFRTHPGVP